MSLLIRFQLLERKFAAPLISVVRSAINTKPWGVGVGQAGDHGLCLEQAVALVGRLGARLVNTRLAVSIPFVIRFLC